MRACANESFTKRSRANDFSNIFGTRGGAVHCEIVCRARMKFHTVNESGSRSRCLVKSHKGTRYGERGGDHCKCTHYPTHSKISRRCY